MLKVALHLTYLYGWQKYRVTWFDNMLQMFEHLTAFVNL